MTRTPSSVVTSRLPDQIAAAEVAIRAAVSDAAEGAGAWDAPTRAAVLGWVERAQSQLAVIRGKALTAERSAGTWAVRGDRDLAGFAGRVSREGRGSGIAAVGQAATLDALPRLADAMVDGAVTRRHVDEVTRATAASPRLASKLATPQGQAEVVRLAARLDGREFGKALRRLSASLDPASRQREHDEQRASRYLTITHAPDGTHVRGLLDVVAGRELAKAIEAHNPRPAKDDERSPDQRRADALVAMARRAITDRTTTPGAVAPVQAVVTLSEDTWVALRGRRPGAGGSGEGGGGRAGTGGGGDGGSGGAGTGGGGDGGIGGGLNSDARLSAAGSTTDVVVRLRGVPPVTDEDGAPWPASEVARALCDCALTRAVLDAGGRVLDLGHRDKDRLFNRSHWLALYAAGRTTCSVSGCSVPLRYTELHHMLWWERGGPTTLDNCAPLCSFHHHEVHRLDLTVRRLAGGTYEHRYPDGRLYGGEPPPDVGLAETMSGGPTPTRHGRLSEAT